MQDILNNNPSASSHYSPSLTPRPTFLNKAGYYALLLLVFALPFELTQRPLFDSKALVVSNVSLLLYITLALGLLSLSGTLLAFIKGVLTGKNSSDNFFYRRRLALLLFAALFVAAIISSLLAKDAVGRNDGLKWTAQLGSDELLWLVILWWLENKSRLQIERLGLALVLGATISASVGLLEFGLGPHFAESMDGWFKAEPTMAGPYLRLSGTFEYANIAAMYFEMALPFTLAGLLNAIAVNRQWWRVGLWVLAIIILLEALLLTLSRGAWLGFGVSLLIVVVVLIRQQHWIKGWVVALGLTGSIVLSLGMLAFVFAPQFALRFNSQSDQDWYKANYSGTPPSVMTVCQDVNVAVRVQNLGPLVWYAAGAKPFNLSYHWLYLSGQIAQFEGVRSALGTNLLPNHTQTVQAHIEAPAKQGQYLLVWDMVQEDVSWFALKSPNNTRLPVQVEDLPPMEKKTACNTAQAQAAVREVSPLTTLPQILEQPNRIALWKAAFNMVVARPLFGVGPNGYRLNYGSFAAPPLLNWDTSIFANNMLLEVLADLGIVGGGLFGALVIFLMWPLLRGVRDRTLSLWQVATLGALTAFFVHGLVDYFLSSHSIHVLFWVLLALATLAVGNASTGSKA